MKPTILSTFAIAAAVLAAQAVADPRNPDTLPVFGGAGENTAIVAKSDDSLSFNGVSLNGIILQGQNVQGQNVQGKNIQGQNVQGTARRGEADTALVDFSALTLLRVTLPVSH